MRRNLHDRLAKVEAAHSPDTFQVHWIRRNDGEMSEQAEDRFYAEHPHLTRDPDAISIKWD